MQNPAKSDKDVKRKRYIKAALISLLCVFLTYKLTVKKLRPLQIFDCIKFREGAELEIKYLVYTLCGKITKNYLSSY